MLLYINILQHVKVVINPDLRSITGKPYNNI